MTKKKVYVAKVWDKDKKRRYRGQDRVYISEKKALARKKLLEHNSSMFTQYSVEVARIR